MERPWGFDGKRDERLAGEQICASAIPPPRKGGDLGVSEVYGGRERPGAAAGIGWRRIDSESGGLVGGFVLKRAGGESGI